MLALSVGRRCADGCEAECVHAGVGAHVECVGDKPHRATDEPDSELADEEPGIDGQGDQQSPSFLRGVAFGVHVADVVNVAGTETQRFEHLTDRVSVGAVLDEDVAVLAVELDPLDVVDVVECHTNELFFCGAVHRRDVEAADRHDVAGSGS